MDKIIDKVISDLIVLKEENNKTSHIKTAKIRDLSNQNFKQIKDKSLYNVLTLSERLLEERTWETQVIAFDWAFRLKDQYSLDTYDIFYSWLEKYVRNWYDVDDLCCHAFGYLIMKYKELFQKVITWTESPHFWIRRAAAVVLIPAIMKNNLLGINPFIISNKLFNDEHYLVLKAYGWMLKVLSKYKKEEVIDYLINHIYSMPRISFRYAIEKMDNDTKMKLMSL